MTITVQAMQETIDIQAAEIQRLTESVGALQGALDKGQATIVGLKRQLARLESGHKQTIYPWKAE